MQKINNQILFSASDLTFFAECPHRTWLDRLHLDSPMEKAEDDEQSKLVQAKGFEHEAEFFAQLKTQYEDCIEIDQKLSLDQRVSATSDALKTGAKVVYQAALKRGNMLGNADFLLRTDSNDEGEAWEYEVADTKLARSTKAKFILQLCFYSDLLSDLTEKLPPNMHVELGNGKRESFRVADYVYYYRQLLDRFVEFLGTYPDGTPPYPVPCDHCSLCHWQERCDAKRIEDDHLSAVANITRQQIARLEQADIKTVAQLAQLQENMDVPKLADQTLTKLREQAKLQVHERETGEQKVVLLPVHEDEMRGFARLPKPDAGDLFFDMEGDPMQDGGLEYLFGVYYFDAGKPVFKPFWAHDREQERQAFIEFMDFVMDRREKYPAMHIYHYAHYENTALKKLMTLHGVKESAVDQLLRESRLVDLYKVVREGLRISKPSYSIKAVEAFYSDKRDAEVTNAGDSIVVYERWRETQDPELLESIREYNEDDCRSTWQLREWLLTMRPEELSWFSEAIIDAVAAKKPAKTKSDKTLDHEKTLEEYHEKLITSPVNLGLDEELAKLVDSLLDFYRRAAKPAWWNIFERQDGEFEELIEDPEVIAGLHSPEYVGSGKRFEVFRYHYPEQDFKVKAGGYAKRLDTLKDVNVVDIDEDNCTVTLEIRTDSGDESGSFSISTGAPINSTVMQDALFDFADSLIAGSGQYKAVLDYLTRKAPDIEGINSGEPIVDLDGDPLAQTISAVEKMQNTYLFIQGPPGTGKTYTGSHLIAELLKSGKRVAVSSNSHKAINNLLSAVDKRMKEKGASYYGIKKVSTDEHHVESDFIENWGSSQSIAKADPPPQLLAGTAWLLARGDFRGEYDYLFIDEAGQVSLANTIAMGMCSRNLVLLGDQMQLGQPIQGVHPGRSGESALDYLLDGEATISPDRGIFLATTYRMHPDVCQFISGAIYDSRLKSDESTFKQALVLNDGAHPALKPTGIRYVPVDHDACSQRSEEEAADVSELVDNLLTQSYRDGKGVVHPMTLEDILIVAPYNMQVNLLKRTLPKGARVGTVDKFQGQEAQVVIVSMTTSNDSLMPRNLGFLFSKNRFNVAVSRARCMSLVLGTERLLDARADTPEDIHLINTLNHFSIISKQSKD